MLIDNIYYISFIWIAMIAFIPFKQKSLKIILASLPLIYISMYRFGQGIDYFSYEFLYNNQDVSSFGSMLNHQVRFETGFRFLIYLFKANGFTFQYFAGSISILILVFMLLWLKDNSEYPIFSLFIFYGMFFLVWTLSALRQGLVISIGTYLFFSKEKKINSLILEVIVVLLLSTIHYSALVYLLFILLRYIEPKSRIIYIVFGISLIVTFLPMKSVIESLSFIPFSDKLLTFAQNGYGFFDFSGMTRLLFSIYTIYLIERFAWDKKEKFILNSTIVGFTLYFFMKFNEVFAGRIAAYTFILFPVIFSWHLKKINFKSVQIVLSSVLLMFSVVYFQKDVKSGQFHQGLLNPTSFIRFKHIKDVTNEDYWPFDNQYSFYTYYRTKSKDKFMKFHNENELTLHDVSDNSKFLVAKSTKTHAFGLIDDQSNWVVYPEYKSKPILHTDLIEISVDGSIQNVEYIDVFKRYKNKEDINKGVYNSLVAQQKFREHKPNVSEVNYKEFEKELEKVFPNPKKLSHMRLITYDEPFTYSILQVRYFNYTLFVYLDENQNLLVEDVFRELIRYNKDGLLWAKNFFSDEAINSKGETIYYE